MRNDFNFHRRAFGQRGDLHRRARREIFREMLRVNFIHAGEVREVGQEHRAFHDVGKGEFLVVENRLYVLQHAFGLHLDVAGDEVAVSGIDGNLPGAKQQVADADSMVIRPDGCGRFRGFDDGFGGHRI